MKYLLSTIFGAATLALVQPHVTLAQNAIQPDIQTQVAKFTVKVNPDGEWGSGAIVGKNGNTYYVLTARHVINDILSGEELWLITHDNQDHQVNVDRISFLPNNIDLALVQFTSKKNYLLTNLFSNSSSWFWRWSL